MGDNQNINYTLSLKDLFSRKMGQAIDTTARLDKRMDSLGNKIKKTGEGFGKLYSTIAGAGATYALVKFGKAVVDSLSKYEMFLASVKSMLQGNKGAAEALNSQLEQLAKTTPFQLQDVRDGAKQLLAYGYQAGEVTKNLRMLGDISAGVGAPLGDIVYLMGTLKVQNRAFTKDIYQFQGRGINVVKELAKQFKVTESAIMDMAKKGEIKFRDVQKAFQAMTAEGGIFFNLMEEQSKTVGGKLSNLSDAWNQLETEIGKSQRGIIAGTIQFMLDLTESLAADVKLSNFRENVNKRLGEKDKVHETTWYNPFSWSWGGLNNKDDKKDERYIATNKNGGQRQFRSSWEQQNFLNNSVDGEGWNDNGSIGTEARLISFQDKWSSKLEKVASKPNDLEIARLKSELMQEKLGIREEQKLGTISSQLGRSEIATLEEVLTRLTDLKTLNTITPTKPQKEDGEKKDELGTGIDTTMHRPQNLYISIDRLVESLNINTTNLTESSGKIKEEVAKALIEAVNDVNYMDGK